jgi:hypothetical protein
VKKRRILIAGGALLLSAFAACEPYLSLDEALTGKACAAAEPRCAAGYVCNGELKCVPSVELNPLLPGNGGAAATVGAGAGNGEADAGADPAGSAGAGAEPQQGSAGASGNESTPAGGAGGTAGSVSGSAGAGAVPMNAGGSEGDDPPPNPTGAADAGCVPQLLFRDLDGDGFGGTSPEDIARGCPPLAGFATKAGDCHDAEPSIQDPAGDVFPGQTRFFTAPYPAPSGPSFDYDCSGGEEADESNSEFVPAPADCEERTTCGLEIGYRIPSDPRTGAGVNPLCGTRDVVVCTGASPGCSLLQIGGTPFRCR